MAKGQSLQLPQTPTYQTDPIAQQGSQNLLKYGQDLSSGNLPQWLQPLLDNRNNALQSAQATLQPQFRDTLQQINNQAAANGQLNSSTYTDALARSQSDLNSQYQSIVSQQAIADNNAKLGLFGTGLQTLNQATQFGQNNQDSQNRFNLDNYSNLVANAIQNNQNANKANGWQQVLGMMSPIGHDYLQSQGINSVPGYGVADVSKILGSFSGFGGGMGGVTGNPSTSAGMSASNSLIGSLGQQGNAFQQYLRY